MSDSVNEAMLIGNLGAKPEVKDMKNGQKMAVLSVATGESWKDKDGKRQNRTEWHRVTVFSPGMVKMAQTLEAGRKILVRGTIRTRSYEKDGVKKYATEVVVEGPGSMIRYLDNKPAQAGTAAPAEVPSSEVKPTDDAAAGYGWDDGTSGAPTADTEVPF